MTKFIVKNDWIEAVFDSRGGQLCSMKRNQKEYIWKGDPEYWPWHSPILFPFVGRVKNLEYRYENIQYSMKPHGFAREKEFKLIYQKNNEIAFSLVWDEESYSTYPFRFELILGYELIENRLLVKWIVKNIDQKKIYFSIGGHPAFYCPMEENGELTDHYLDFHHEQIQYQLLQKEGLLKREVYDLPLDEGRFKITQDLFSKDALIIAYEGQKKVSLCMPNKKPYVSVIFDTPIYGVYSQNRKEAPFVCIEPWYGRCDAQDFEGDLTEREFGQVLEVDAVFQGGYVIEFYI